MNQLVTSAIILSRTDYGEADRILTLLTPDHGKLRLMAKGVRRVKSKLAGGIELFSVSAITFVKGRGEIGTLVSTRLNKYYRHIVQDLDRTMLGYELLKQLNKITEDEPEEAYFELMQASFEALDSSQIPLDVIRFWFRVQLLKLGGETPNLQTDTTGQKLRADQVYNFSVDTMSFTPAENGRFMADHIKLLRLAFVASSPKVLTQVQDSTPFIGALASLVDTMHHNRA